MIIGILQTYVRAEGYMAKAKKSVPDADTSEVFASEVETKRPFMRSKKAQLVSAAVLILMVVVAVGLLAMLGGSKSKDGETTIRPDFQEKVQAVKAEGLADPAKANQTLDSLKNEAKTSQEKAYVEYMYAEVAVNNGDYDKAIKLAQKANKVEETASSYGLIGFAAKMKENWQLAADSFAKAAELSPDSEAGDRSPRNDYKLMEAEMRAKL